MTTLKQPLNHDVREPINNVDTDGLFWEFSAKSAFLTNLTCGFADMLASPVKYCYVPDIW